MLLAFICAAVLLPLVFLEREDEVSEDDVEGAASSEDHFDQVNSLQGTAENDVLFSEPFSEGNPIKHEAVHGMEGDDTIFGSGSSVLYGGVGNDVLVMRNMAANGSLVRVTGGDGVDHFLVEFTESGDSANDLCIISDYDPVVDVIGLKFHNSVFFNENSGALYDTSYTLEGFSSEQSEAGITLSFDVMKTTIINGSEGSLKSEELLVRKVLLEGTQDFDPSALGIVTS